MSATRYSLPGESRASFPANARLAARVLAAGRLCAAAVGVIALAVIVGWSAGAGALKNIGLGGEAMKVNTAIGLLAASLCLSALTGPGRRARLVVAIAALLVLLDGAAHLGEYLFGIDLGIDGALFEDAKGLAHPGRMSPSTALAFVLFASAAMLAGRGPRRAWTSNLLACGVLGLGLAGLVGELAGAASLSEFGGHVQMSAPAGISFILLGSALLLAGPASGTMSLLTSSGPGGALARKLLPAAIAVPPALVLLAREGQALGLYDRQAGLLMMILLMVAAASTLAWVLARELDRKAAARETVLDELRKSERRFRDMFENATVGMALENLEGRVIDANRALCEMLGYSEQELVGRTFAEITHPDEVGRDLGQLQRMLAGEERTHRVEKRYLHEDGHVVWAILSVSLALDSEGRPLHFIAQMQDITARKRSEERFAYLAYHDELTDLPNRSMFQNHLEMALARAERHDLGVAVLYVDVDNFKIVNESLGHAAGDSVLCEIANRLRRAVRAEDLVARHTGDEFMVLLADLERSAERVDAAPGWSGLPAPAAAAMRYLHQVLGEPFEIGEQDFTLQASIGISVFPDDAGSAEELLQHAGVAVNESKRTAPGLTRMYSHDSADPGGELALRSHLRAAVEKEQLVLHYQPILALAPALEAARAGRFNLAEHTVMVEALMRWQDPLRGLVSPAQFIPLAEQSGLIEPIGEWLIEEVSRQARSWKEQGVDVSIAFNLSPRQMRQPTVMRHLLDRIIALGADPERLIVELTESVAVESPAHTQLQFREARASGLRSAVDDFGAGYSSLGRLLEIHPDYIKIDRSLTEGIPTNAGAMAIVAGAVRISRGLGATPILEGIETAEQWQFAVEQGCVLGQGFHLGRPQPAEQITPLLIRKSPAAA